MAAERRCNERIMRAERDDITQFFRGLQEEICVALTDLDGASFREDAWERPGGGGGRARVINGEHIEKGGVNFSAVHGQLPPAAAQSLKIGTEATDFYATGVSIVLHPRNVHVPIIHMNVRYFEVDGGRHWFGGGIDLTPHYIVAQDAAYFHGELKAVCDRFDPKYYPRFKTWADDYFYLPHRQETRGVGGIFFDRLEPATEGKEKSDLFAFTAAVGRAFAPIYSILHLRHRQKKMTEAEQRWQELRRGRYVEFNLVWDRGTKFGLTTNGRTESILMSLPPLAGWTYAYEAEAGSREAFTLEHLKKDIDWLSYL